METVPNRETKLETIMYTENDEHIICKHKGCGNECPPKRVGNKGVIQAKQCRTCSILVSNYGIHNGDRKRMLEEQNYSCAICKKHIEFQGQTKKGDKGYHAAVVDHCHTTGKLRKLLCSACNLSIGQFNDSIETLEAAINYLKSFK
jgi:hypothetical protein